MQHTTAAHRCDDQQVRRQLAHSLEMTYHLGLGQVAVRVHDGVARLAGRVERHRLAEEVERLAAAVDGVIAVESELTWELDDPTVAVATVRG